MSPNRRMTKLMKYSPLKRISKISDVSVLASLPMVSKKHSESLIDSLNDQMFGIKYE
jgi:Holliday junction resolvasome RuvABC DNA-binding subunit